jgi:serine/threonine protein kinase
MLLNLKSNFVLNKNKNDPEINKCMGLCEKVPSYDEILDIESKINRTVLLNWKVHYNINTENPTYDAMTDSLVAEQVEMYKKHQISAYFDEKFPKFRFVRDVGNGRFGKVVLIKRFKKGEKFQINMKNHEYFVLKIIDKKSIKKNFKNVDCLYTERNILNSLFHPNIAFFLGCYQSLRYVFQVTEYLCCGTLSELLKNEKFGPMNEKRLKFYSAQLLTAVEYLNSCQIVHRDLCSSNMCLDYQGYLKIIDFSLAEYVEKKDLLTGKSFWLSQLGRYLGASTKLSQLFFFLF